ncbi:exonuclease [Aminobacter phage Erebus]|nr:exonuclease [Aminobacter phage Erebus]
MVATILDRINGAIKTKAAAEDPFRNHLGGSMIGKPCERELFYNFRWAVRPNFNARMLRLFDRGHKEEFRFVQYLRDAGVIVWEYAQDLMRSEATGEYMLIDWDADRSGGMGAFVSVSGEEHVKAAELQGVKVKQWRISDVRGHFGGSFDGISHADFDVWDAIRTETREPQCIPAGEEFLNEFKTHNDKSFKALVNARAVKEAKPVHWAQMQIYMHKRGLKYALYMAVNKNDDDLYTEVLTYDPEAGPVLLAKAERVISMATAPNRIGKHPSWHECKFCEYAKICHYGEAPDRNCRSCRHAVPVDDGRWQCAHWNMLIPGDAILSGCDNYKAISD